MQTAKATGGTTGLHIIVAAVTAARFLSLSLSLTLHRWYANIFFKVLEIASMSLLLLVLDCQLFEPPGNPEARYRHQKFPEMSEYVSCHDDE